MDHNCIHSMCKCTRVAINSSYYTTVTLHWSLSLNSLAAPGVSLGRGSVVLVLVGCGESDVEVRHVDPIDHVLGVGAGGNDHSNGGSLVRRIGGVPYDCAKRRLTDDVSKVRAIDDSGKVETGVSAGEPVEVKGSVYVSDGGRVGRRVTDDVGCEYAEGRRSDGASDGVSDGGRMGRRRVTDDVVCEFVEVGVSADARLVRVIDNDVFECFQMRDDSGMVVKERAVVHTFQEIQTLICYDEHAFSPLPSPVSFCKSHQVTWGCSWSSYFVSLSLSLEKHCVTAGDSVPPLSCSSLPSSPLVNPGFCCACTSPKQHRT